MSRERCTAWGLIKEKSRHVVDTAVRSKRSSKTKQNNSQTNKQTKPPGDCLFLALNVILQKKQSDLGHIAHR